MSNINQERWTPISGFRNYAISNHGRIKRVAAWKNTPKDGILKPSIGDKGYHYITLWKNEKAHRIRISRLVALNFLEKQNNKNQVNHKNSIKSDNRVENLEWVTAQENRFHAHKNGLYKKCPGELCGHAKLREEDVIEIRRLCENKKLSQRKIAGRFGVTQRAISLIKIRKNWSHLK